MTQPKLRSATTIKPLQPLNGFSKSFSENVAKKIFAVKATTLFSSKGLDISGSLWEQIFASSMGVERESAVANGLDDIQDKNTSTAWGAKTVKWSLKSDLEQSIEDEEAKVQLISGRNSPKYSYDKTVDPKIDDPKLVGELILGIWNARVQEVRKKYSNLRTVVMVKGKGLNQVVIFEKDTVLYDFNDYSWSWNDKNNLKGMKDGKLCFTWQTHGSQFTINNVYIPKDALIIDIDKPNKLNEAFILKEAGWNKACYQVK